MILRLDNNSYFYHIYPTPFGEAAFLWNEETGRPLVIQVVLSRLERTAQQVVSAVFPAAVAASCDAIDKLAAQMVAFLQGENITFSLDTVRLDRCSAFQQKVLYAEHAIPRGRVSSYARIAAHIGHAGAGRAVGAALATNPFPLIIPCHRAIRTDGSFGEYQGGPDMKKKLLEMEGLRFDGKGRIGKEYFIYQVQN